MRVVRSTRTGCSRELMGSKKKEVAGGSTVWNHCGSRWPDVELTPLFFLRLLPAPAMEPTPQELESFKNAGDICEWADLPDQGEAASNPRRTLLAALGATENTHVRLLAAIPEAKWSDILNNWRIGEAEPSAIHLASAGLVGTAARLAAGAEPTRAEREKKQDAEAKAKMLEAEVARLQAVAAKSPPGPSSRSIKLATVVDQASDREVPPLGDDDVEKYYEVFRALKGHNPRPEEDITLEQLTGLQALFESGAAPYVDLSIWGPFGHRLQRKLKASGMVMGPDGVLQNIQFYGPPNVESWQAGFAVFRTGCIMLGEVSLSTLELWANMVGDYAARYGPSVWALLYQTEVRARSELLTRTKRAGAMAKAQAIKAGGTHPFDAAKPWDWVFREAAGDSQFWRKELEENALLVLAKIAKPADAVEGDAPTSQHPQAKRARDFEVAPAGPPSRAPRRGFERQHRQTAEGLMTHNRRGLGLCQPFQRGECGASGPNAVCPRDQSLRHQCARCLQLGHGLHQCTSNVSLQDNTRKGKGGKGGGKGKGKKGHFPY